MIPREVVVLPEREDANYVTIYVTTKTGKVRVHRRRQRARPMVRLFRTISELVRTRNWRVSLADTCAGYAVYEPPEEDDGG